MAELTLSPSREIPEDATQHIFPLLALPVDVLVNIFSKLDAKSMAMTELVSGAFRSRHPGSGIRLVEQAAREAFERRYGPRQNASWRDPSWKKLLYYEDSGVGFDVELGEREGFAFEKHENSNRLKQVKLVGLGPKMLVSDLSSHQQSIMRWRLRVKGNTAVEFGVVPVCLQERKKALHKCLAETDNVLCVGFCSQITVGSQLPFRCPVVKGTIVEITINRGKAEFIVLNPSDGWDVRWENDRRVHSQYRGPGEIKFTQEFSHTFDVKLALTAWAKADFDVLHTTYCKPTPATPSKEDKIEAVMNNNPGPHNLDNPQSPSCDDLDEMM